MLIRAARGSHKYRTQLAAPGRDTGYIKGHHRSHHLCQIHNLKYMYTNAKHVGCIIT